MCRNRLLFMPALLLLLIFGGVVDAGTLSSVTLEGSAGPALSAGSIPYCSASDVTNAFCYMSAFEDGGWGVQGWGDASSAFGKLTGSFFGDISFPTNALGYGWASLDEVQFTSDFSDPVLITGGSGQGTLVAHFAWMGCNEDVWGYA